MDLLAALRAFSRVAENGSFSAVAREMGTTQPAVSRQVAGLEDHLGVRLLQRTTRALTLTEDGRDLLAHAARVMEEIAELEAAIGRRRTSPAGLVRLGCSVSFGRMYLAPRMNALLARYPELEIELSLSDGIVDLIHEGLDLAVRIGAVSDTSLVARRIGSTERILAASTAYLEQHGEPGHPSQLVDHPCIIYTRPGSAEWAFEGPDGPISVRVSGRFRTDSGEAAREAVVLGIGIAYTPAWMFRDELVAGTVKAILPAWRGPRLPIQAVYPSRRHLAPRTRAVIDFLVNEFRLDPVISSYGES